jgi:surface antigen
MGTTLLNAAATAAVKSAALAAAFALALPVPAQAQFGGLLRSKPRESSSGKTATGCDDSAGKAVGRSVLGGMLGSVTGRMGGLASFLPVPEVAGLLTDAIACKLEPKEQKQAADATLEATRGEEVGSTSTWKSDTRKDVSGTSTVVGKTQLADGSTCMNVNDVIIVEGEETTVSKKMCKKPGSARYEIAQA